MHCVLFLPSCMRQWWLEWIQSGGFNPSLHDGGRGHVDCANERISNDVVSRSMHIGNSSLRSGCLFDWHTVMRFIAVSFSGSTVTSFQLEKIEYFWLLILLKDRHDQSDPRDEIDQNRRSSVGCSCYPSTRLMTSHSTFQACYTSEAVVQHTNQKF